MFGSRKRERLQTAFRLIAQSGRATAQACRGEASLQWNPAQEWITFCGCIPAFACLAVIEGFKSPRNPKNTEFYKTIEDALFSIYRDQSKSHTVLLKHCVPVRSERNVIREALGVPEDVQMRMDTILGVIFPDRFHIYQRDIIEGYNSDCVNGPYDYVAMRFASHLMGIETPQSMRGITARDLGLKMYAETLLPLVQFSDSYLEQRKDA